MKFSKKILYVTLSLGALGILFSLIYSSQALDHQSIESRENVSKKDLLDTTNWKTWEDSEKRYSFKYPPNFVLKKYSTNDLVSIIYPKELTLEEIETVGYINISAEIVYIDINKTGGSMTHFQQSIKEQLPKTEGKDILIDGKAAYKVIVNHGEKGDSVSDVVVATQIDQRTAFRFDVLFRKLTYDEKLTETILSTIELK